MIDAKDPVTEMTRHETAVFNLLRGKELAADHPVTVLNPDEWFTPSKVSISNDRVWVCGPNTCWFSLQMCRVRDIATTKPQLAAEAVMDLHADHEGPVEALTHIPVGTKLYIID